jgi:hypothetical protein
MSNKSRSAFSPEKKSDAN